MDNNNSDIHFYWNSLDTEIGKMDLCVSDNMCNTFVYAEFLLKKYTSYVSIDNDTIHNVLDVGCGAGPFCVFFGIQGKSVDGIDINPIAIECLKQNIKKYSLEHSIKAIKTSIEEYYSNKKYDLIICNPPIGNESYMRKNILSERDRIYNKITENIIDAEVEDFLTNCWTDSNGKDVMDHIFMRSKQLMSPKGKILFVCGDDFLDGGDFIYKKIYDYPYIKPVFKHKYTEHLSLEDAGETYECDKNYNVILLEYIN